MDNNQPKNLGSKIGEIAKEISLSPFKPLIGLYDKLTPDLEEKISSRRQRIQSLKKKYQEKRTMSEKMADTITNLFGSIGFASFHIVWFILWVLWNTNIITDQKAFDPYPFGLLTMIVSLEAIFLSVFVLISQNRESTINDLREEIDLQINVQAEEQIQRTLKKLDEIYLLLNPQGKSAVPTKRNISPAMIEKELEEE